MARAVLTPARFCAAALLLALSLLGGRVSWSQSPASPCAPPELASMAAASQKQVRDLQQRVEAGPFYKKMLQQLGKPQSCSVKQEGDSIALSYAFRDEAHLDAQVNATIESSMQRAEFRGLNREKALALLKKGESESYGKGGCGIDWSKPEDQSMGDPPGSHATVFRGDSCNCQARIVYQGDSVVALVLSSAC
ncbi:MAG TPA: hypothetical protein VMQ56_01165 [Terracidiphilus sp.]|jgi:hypothetical protein|nr:hypothetical protein [Terracidiphilus sp.]